MVVPINHVVRAFKSDIDALSLLLVDKRILRFACFAGGVRPRDLALEALRATAAAKHPQAPFLALLPAEHGVVGTDG